MQELWQLAQYLSRLNYEQISSRAIDATRYVIFNNMGAALGAAHQSEIIGYMDESLLRDEILIRSVSYH